MSVKLSEKARQTHKALKAKRDTLIQEIETLEEQKEKLESEVEDLKATLEDLQKKYGELVTRARNLGLA
ncbi:MAG: hypothetical protein JHC26_05225 [Thermofilum sp.]|jgi:vacuolar-type H+-ATPase subunit D/Vma8|uniref:hypothetical protein n=1 Tax=Thermofilum sp. TaxID=1961369 RepID=UPI00258946D0|nr:hypothetical protein [Thermofilum sp.]MCI4408472.1 hypothetical protein [Thermofilum sp.]